MEVILLLWQQITWKDFVDIAIVALLIYQGILIIHGTRSVQILLGVGLLMILFWVALSYRLYSLSWVLQHFFDSFFIIAIILFQDQIKAALASVGSRNFLGLSSSEASEIELEEVVEVAGALSREGVGALMVLERTNGLSNYIESGTKMGSEIHSDILYALFQSSSPLHDGAVIIRKGKIEAAGCFLPLSKNIEIDRHLGTRHRAALGLSEVTDAVVVTVSEETGAITLACQGELYPCEGERHLRQYLKQLWSHSGVKLGVNPIKFEDLQP